MADASVRWNKPRWRASEEWLTRGRKDRARTTDGDWQSGYAVIPNRGATDVCVIRGPGAGLVTVSLAGR